MKRTVMLLAGLFPIVGGCTQPSALYQRASVAIVDKRVCVSVTGDSDDATPPRLAGVTLSRLSGDGAEAVWDLDFTGAAEPFILSPGECLRPGAPYGEGVVEMLLGQPVPGERYALAITGAVPADEPGGDGWAARLYRENFCLKQHPSGATTIVPVPWDVGRPRWEACSE